MSAYDFFGFVLPLIICVVCLVISLCSASGGFGPWGGGGPSISTNSAYVQILPKDDDARNASDGTTTGADDGHAGRESDEAADSRSSRGSQQSCGHDGPSKSALERNQI